MTGNKKIRQPIISVLGHVNSGKTTLLDYIRGSLVVEKEAGSITQMIGATEVPIDKIEDICGGMLDSLETELTIPGLLLIDTPGHAAFTSLRKRGGSLSDIAVLVIDVEDGVQPQTKEAIEILTESKTPFVIALNKIDRIPGWKTDKKCWTQNFQNQKKKLRQKLDTEIYKIMGDLNEYGLVCERFDRVDNFRKKIGIIPVSAETGEGIPELLMVLSGLTQRFLSDELVVHEGVGKGTVLEVNEVKGMGKTIDIIHYDGTIRKNDKLLLGGKNGLIETKVKAILKSKPLTEIRREKEFERLEEISPASGVKISAKNLEDAMAGSPVRAVSEEKDLEKARREIEKEIKDLQIQTTPNGTIVKADSLGSLEAVSKVFKESGIPIAKAEVGQINKKDLLELKGSDDEYRVVFGFNTPVNSSAVTFQRKNKEYQIITSEIIYELVDNYKEWKEELEKKKRMEALSSIARPGKFRIMPDHVFRSSKPAVVGVEIVDGAVSPNSKFMTKDGERLGTIKAVQEGGESIDLAEKGSEVAVSLTNVQVGRQVEEGETYYTDLEKEDYKKIQEMMEYISDNELNTLSEIVEIKDNKNPRWRV